MMFNSDKQDGIDFTCICSSDNTGGIVWFGF